MLDTLPRTAAEVRAPGLGQRLRDHRRLRRLDRLGARLARLDAVDDLLGRVAVRLAAGWTQDAWFVTVEDGGVRRHVGSLHAEHADRDSASCLVAAVAIEALPGSITGPEAQRALGSLWTVLHGGALTADRAGPAAVTTVRAYDLIRWNDAADRRQSDVLALVATTRGAVTRTSTTVRGELATA